MGLAAVLIAAPRFARGTRIIAVVLIPVVVTKMLTAPAAMQKMIPVLMSM